MAYLKIEYKSLALGRGAGVTVFLPSDGMAGEVKLPYKTLYFLPGYSATATEIYTYLSFRAQAELKGIAIVIPEGENLFYQDYKERGTLYSTYVGKELVEETRKLLPLSRERADTYIGGISMGGYGAIYNGLKYKETFSKIIAFSPAANCYNLLVEAGNPGSSISQFNNYFGSKENYMESESNLIWAYEKADSSKLPELFLCCGRDDKLVFSAVKKLEEALVRLQIKHVYREESGDHEFDFWNRMMDPAFSFLVGIPEGSRAKLLSTMCSLQDESGAL